MNAAKRIFALALSLALTGSFAACSQPTADNNAIAVTAPTEETVPLFERELTEAEKAILQERRDIAEAHMRESLSILWTSD